MIMNNRRVFYDESMWEKVENKVKNWTYALMHELLQNQVCSIFLYKLLILIETIQLVYYSVHPNLSFLFTTAWLTYFQDVIQYFQINSILNSGGVSVFLIILYLVFVVQIIMLVLVIIITYNIVQSKRKTSTFLTYILKIFSLYGLLLNTIVTIPFLNIFIATIYCNSNAPFSQGLSCYQGIDFLHIAIAVIGLILFLIFLLMFGLLYVELNPNSQLPFAAPQSKTNFLKQLLKLVLPFYITLDYNGIIQLEYIALLAVYYLIMLIQRYRTPPQYNKGVYLFIIVSEVILFWFTLVSVITAFLNQGSVQNIGLFYLVLGIPFVSLTYIQIINRKNKQLMMTNIKAFKKESDIEVYINIMMDLIETREKPESRIYLEGVLKLHVKNCNKNQDNCVCQSLASDNLKDDETLTKQKRWYLLIRSIMTDALEKFPKCPRLHLLNAYIHHEKLNNKFRSLYELMITEENKPNLQEEFSMYRYKNLIEEEMMEADIRSSEQKGVDVNIIVVFQNKFVEFLSSIEKSVNLHLEFWRELLEENPDIQKLQSLGSKITNTVESTNEIFKKLTDMNPNHIKCLEIYGNFLKEIVNDDVEGQRTVEKSEYIGKSMNKQFTDNDRQKYGENSNTCIVTVSGNFNNIGIVTNSNNEITRILQYSKSDIIGQNINRIMPKVFADQHDYILRNFLETSDTKVIALERLVLAQNKQGYLVPCTLMIKILPNLDEGIQIVGFLKDLDLGTNQAKENDKDEKFHYMIYNANTLVIMGITYSCFQSFGIPAQLMYGNTTNTNEFTLDAIAPELADLKNFDELKTTGMVANFDTTAIQQNYLLGHGDSEDEMSFEEDHNLIQRDDNDQLGKQNTNNNLSQINQSMQVDTLVNNKYNAHNNTNNNINNTNNNITNNNHNNSVHNSHMMEEKQAKIKKVVRYRKTRVRAQIIDDNEFGDWRIQVLKFIEVDENEEIKQQRSGQDQMDDNANILATKAATKVTDDVQANQVLDDNNQSDRESNISGVSVNDEMRQLKDFKALISEKTEPKLIKILKRTVWFLMAIMVIITAIILGYRIQQNSDVLEGANAIYGAYYRHDIMADVNFNTRLLSMLSTGLYWARNNQGNATVEQQIKSNLSTMVNNLQNIQFNVIKARIVMESRQTTPTSLETYPIQFLLQNNQTKVYFNIYNDALFQLITSASSIGNSTEASYNVTNTILDTQKNFFYVMQNGFTELRAGSEKIAKKFYNFYSGYVQGYQTTFIAIMSAAMVFLVISQVILIPIVFQVHKTNNRVMSLFGIIPISEIRELASKCEKYMQLFLVDKNEKKEEGEVDQKEVQQENPEQEEVEGDDVDSKERSHNNMYFEVDNDDKMMNADAVNKNIQNQKSKENKNQPNKQQQQAQSQIISRQTRNEQTKQTPPSSQNSKDKKDQHNKNNDNMNTPTPQPSKDQKHGKTVQPGHQAENVNKDYSKSAQPGKTDKEKRKPGAITQGPTKNGAKLLNQKEEEKKEEENDIENLRSQKLLNSKDNNKSIVICQFSFLAMCFISYFIADIVLETQYLNNISTIYNHLKLISMRPSQIKYTIYFTIEQVVNGNPQIFNGTDQAQNYNQLVYQNERDIFNSLQNSFPSDFAQYQSTFQGFNYNSLCDYQFSFMNFTMNQAECQTVDNGLLLKGLRTAIVSVTLSTNDIISNYNQHNVTNRAQQTQAVQSIINDVTQFDNLQFLLKYIAPAADYLNVMFMTNLSTFLTNWAQVETIKFSIFVVFMFLVFVLFWTPYLNNLSKQIWRTKGMLNMIPMEIIQKYPNLKDAFIGGDILQAVK